LRQNTDGGFLFIDPAKSEAASAPGDRICSDFNGPLHNLPGGIKEFRRDGLTFKQHFVGRPF
jgi:hypothetical protein